MRELSYDQAEWLRNRLGPTLVFFSKVKKRLSDRGYTPDDPLYREVSECYNAVHHLRVSAHYLSCRSGVGKKPEE
jgi:hypothetical protein